MVSEARDRRIFWGGSVCDVIDFKSNQNTNESTTLGVGGPEKWTRNV